MDLRNNVFYNWGGNGCYGGEGMNVNIVNNYYKPGPATLNRSSAIQKRIAAIGIRTSEYTGHNTSSPNEWDKMWHVWGKFYVRGNYNLFNADVTKDNWSLGIYNQISSSSNDGTYTAATKDTMQLGLPIAFYPVTTETAKDAYAKVLAYAGASLHRDRVDSLIVNDTRDCTASFTGSGNDAGFINSQDDLRPPMPLIRGAHGQTSSRLRCPPTPTATACPTTGSRRTAPTRLPTTPRRLPATDMPTSRTTPTVWCRYCCGPARRRHAAARQAGGCHRHHRRGVP
jgi:hypothetical protein